MRINAGNFKGCKFIAIHTSMIQQSCTRQNMEQNMQDMLRLEPVSLYYCQRCEVVAVRVWHFSNKHVTANSETLLEVTQRTLKLGVKKRNKLFKYYYKLLNITLTLYINLYRVK